MSYPNNPPVPASITVDTTASINSGLVGFWPLTHSSGTTATDLSTGGNDGTLTGSITWENGEKGYASEHPSATSTYITTGYSAAGESAITVSAWIRNDGGAVTSDYGKIVSQSHAGNFDTHLKKDTNTSLRLRINSTSVNAVDGDIPSIGTWFHVCFVWEQSVYQGVYINGIESNTATADTSPIGSLTHDLMIGGTSATPRPWDGGIQNVRVYNRALTATEVAELYSVPWTGTDYVAQNLTPDTPRAMGVDPNHSLSSGLVGYWPLSEGSGTVAKDISGNDNDGTESGTVGWASTTIGTAADFDGSNDLFTVSHDASISFDVAAGSTFSAWVAPNTLAGGTTFSTTNPRLIFAKYASNPNTANYFFRLIGGGINLGYRNSTNTSYVEQRSDSEVLTVGVWNHVAAVHTGTAMKLYLNGVEVASSTTSGTVTDSSNTNTEDLIIGSNGTASNRWFDGKIQNARIYNRALSDAEVADLYNEPWAGVVTAKSAPPQYLSVDTADSINTGLQNFWPLSDGDGTTAVDLGERADDLTATGTPTWAASSIGNCVELVSNTTYLSSSVYGNTYDSSTSITISAWVRSANSSNNGLLQYGDATTDGSSLYLLQNNSGTLRWLSKNTYGTGKTVTTDTWHHAVITNDGNESKHYIDGVLSDTITSADTYGESSSNKFWIGAGYRYNNTNQFQNVRVYNRALSAAEVSRLYQDPWAGTDRAIEPSPTVKDLDTSSSLTTNLVGWWPLTEYGPQDTLAYDISGSGNHGVASGGVQRQFTDTVRAATFDGVDDYIDIVGAPANTITQPLTLSAWVYNDAGGSGTNDLVALGKTTSIDPLGIIRFTYSTGQVSAVFRKQSTASIISHTLSNPTGYWHHICVVATSSTSLELFVDGVSEATNTSTNYGTLSYDNLTIGALQRTTLANYSDGKVQNVRLYDRALSAAEVQTLYDDPWVGLTTTSLVYAYYSAAFLQRL